MRNQYSKARNAILLGVLSDPRLSKNTAAFFADKRSRRRLHPAVAHNMLASDPPEHTRLRKLVTNAFTTGAVAELRPSIAETADRLLDRWPVGERVDLVAELAVPLPVTVICELLGVPEADRPQVRLWSTELFTEGHPDRIDAASHAVADYMTDLIAAKRRQPGPTLLDRLIAARDGDDHLSEGELVSLAVLLFVAGHETTTNYLGNAVLALLQHPTELARLRKNPESVPHALDELLRFDSPLSTATFRYTTEAITLGGTEIPAGVPVVIALGAANRDPQRFPSPLRLDLDRKAVGHLGFGHGIHRCLGAPLARAEADIVLRAILSRFPRIRLAVPPGQLRWRGTRLVRGLESLPVLT
ncbi:cytochrome P450 family protein [Streptomyces sp. NPDC004838]